MIRRARPGRTTKQNVGADQSTVRGQVIPGTQARRIPGFRATGPARRDRENDVAFMTVTWQRWHPLLRLYTRTSAKFASQASGQQAAPGTTCGNHRANSPRHPRASPGMVSAVQTRESALGAGRIPCRIPPYKRGVRRFKSYCAHQVYAGRRTVCRSGPKSQDSCKSQTKSQTGNIETWLNPGRDAATAKTRSTTTRPTITGWPPSPLATRR